MRKYMILIGLALAGCGQAKDPTATASTVLPNASTAPSGPAEAAAPGAAAPRLPVSAPLHQRIDCLRESGASVVIAHRGGPTRTHPENAIETLQRTLEAGTRAVEIDIATSADGVLFLMHDDTLERTTLADGEVAALPWEAIREAKLETYSQATDFSPPTLAEALDWAVRNNVLVELDKKRSTAFPAVIEAVRKARAENNVLIITYSDEQAVEVHAAAPDLMITASVRDAKQLDDLAARGVRLDRLVAWTGTDGPDPALWSALAERGVEVAFGTLGPRGERLDDVYWEDRDASEYQTLADQGATFIVTDVSDRVARQLEGELSQAAACGL
jgi:glycerophosphoryl diester phosphodiesterase